MGVEGDEALVEFETQIAMFPGMVNPSINGVIEPEASVQPMIDRYSSMEEVLAWKMPGAGGGGYLAAGKERTQLLIFLYGESTAITHT